MPTGRHVKSKRGERILTPPSFYFLFPDLLRVTLPLISPPFFYSAHVTEERKEEKSGNEMNLPSSFSFLSCEKWFLLQLSHGKSKPKWLKKRRRAFLLPPPPPLLGKKWIPPTTESNQTMYWERSRPQRNGGLHSMGHGESSGSVDG